MTPIALGHRSGLLAALALALSVACDRADEGRPPAPVPAIASAPIDTTEPGELAEGPEIAFGLPIPRLMRVKAKLDDTWYAEGALGLEEVAGYLEARVTPARVERGPNKIVFFDAALQREDGKRVQIELARVQGRLELVVRDRTPPPVVQGLSEEDRWRRAGRTRDGKVLREQAE